jgi:hypothetical protein
MMDYDDMSPIPDKLLRADGSVTTLAGEVILPADPDRAADYESRAPQAAKWLLPDGSLVSELPGGGSDGSGSGGGDPTPTNPIYMGSTNTSASTVIKVVTGLPDGYVPSTGDFLFLNYLTSSNNTANSIQLSIGGTAYPVWFNGMVTNAVTGIWHVGGIIPFYFDGTRFHQLFYPKSTDDNTSTVYTGFFEQNLLSVKITINADRAIDRYQLALEREDGTFDKALSGTASNSKIAAVNTDAVFKIDGMMFFHNSTANLAAGSTVTCSALQLIQSHQTTNLITYGMNGADNLSDQSWVYLVGIPLDNPMLFRLDPTDFTSWYTTTPPTEDDGKVYIKLGYYESGTVFNLCADHPAYWFKDGYFQTYLLPSGIPDAPNDGNAYLRKNGEWVQFIPGGDFE